MDKRPLTIELILHFDNGTASYRTTTRGAENVRQSRFSDAQKAFVVKQGKHGTPVTEICGRAEGRIPNTRESNRRQVDLFGHCLRDFKTAECNNAVLRYNSSTVDLGLTVLCATFWKPSFTIQ